MGRDLEVNSTFYSTFHFYQVHPEVCSVPPCSEKSFKTFALFSHLAYNYFTLFGRGPLRVFNEYLKNGLTDSHQTL